MVNKKNEIKTFILYLFVGGSAAIVEWFVFWLSNLIFHFSMSTILAFISATFFNYLMGRKFAFKKYNKEKSDLSKVFLVSGCGLLINLFLMYIFVDILEIYPLLGKVGATGIVFFWNYLSRRLFIYKEVADSSSEKTSEI